MAAADLVRLHHGELLIALGGGGKPRFDRPRADMAGTHPRRGSRALLPPLRRGDPPSRQLRIERGSAEGATAANRPGRRPTARTEKAILDATRELLAGVGVHDLTVEGVAARAGVAKTTIYRRYRSKDELALAVLLDMVAKVTAVPDLDDTRAELVAFVDGAVKILGSTLMGRVMQGLVSELATNPDLASSFRERVVAMRVGEVRRLVERGIERGDLRSDTDIELIHELLFGPVYYRLFLSGAPLDKGLAARIVDAVLPAFSAGAND